MYTVYCLTLGLQQEFVSSVMKCEGELINMTRAWDKGKF